jgi:hypothetical protein
MLKISVVTTPGTGPEVFTSKGSLKDGEMSVVATRIADNGLLLIPETNGSWTLFNWDRVVRVRFWEDPDAEEGEKP